MSPKPGVVYFAQMIGEYNPIKIGYTTDISSRIQSVAQGLPFELRLVGLVPGDKGIESYIHAKFSHHCIKGEWFYPSPALIEFILDNPRSSNMKLPIAPDGHLPYPYDGYVSVPPFRNILPNPSGCNRLAQSNDPTPALWTLLYLRQYAFRLHRYDVEKMFDYRGADTFALFKYSLTEYFARFGGWCRISSSGIASESRSKRAYVMFLPDGVLPDPDEFAQEYGVDVMSILSIDETPEGQPMTSRQYEA